VYEYPTRHNWTQHRAAIEAGQVVTPVRPFWLDLLDAEGQVVRGRGKGVRYVGNDMARVVLQVFEWADQGYGCHRVSGLLAQRGWKFRRADIVTQTVVWRLLQNRQVPGEHQCYLARDEAGRRQTVGQPLEGYFPRAVPDDLFYRGQKRLGERKKTGGGRQGEAVINRFSGRPTHDRDRHHAARLWRGSCRHARHRRRLHDRDGHHAARLWRGRVARVLVAGPAVVVQDQDRCRPAAARCRRPAAGCRREHPFG
jgi:hypothetical protein